MITLFPYQQQGAAFLSQHENGFLADEMGLGKSAQAISACDFVGANRVLVLCPASARINWAREFEKFQQTDRQIQVILSKADRVNTTGVTICSYDLTIRSEVQSKLFAGKFDVIILDEAHFLKNRKARRTQAVLGHNCSRIAGLIENAKQVYALSGTPAPNHPDELWPVTHALFPKALMYKEKVLDYWSFLKRFCRYNQGPFGIKITGGRNIPELRERLRPYLLRRKKSQVLLELPELRMTSITLEPKKLLQELKDIEAGPQGDRIREVLENADDQGGLAKAAFHVAQLRRLTGLSKVQPVIDLIKDELSGGLDKIVLFAYHREVIDQLLIGLHDSGAVALHGGITAKQRQHVIDCFQQDHHTHVFIGQITAAGTAINLTAASDLLFVEPSWVPAENLQAAMRVHRIGQKRGVLIRFVLLSGSLDERITDTLRRKTAVLNELFQ